MFVPGFWPSYVTLCWVHDGICLVLILTEFKSHATSLTDIKVLPHGKGFAGVKFWHKHCLYIRAYQRWRWRLLNSCIQDLCQLRLWTGTRLCYRGRKKKRAEIAESGLEGKKSRPPDLLRSPYFIFSRSWEACSLGSLKDGENSPRLSRNVMDTDLVSRSPVLVNTVIFGGKLWE